MRRLAAILATLLAAAGVAAALLSSSAQGSSTSSFAVIFDDARGLVGGQLVKVAGAQAGTIQNVVVVKQGSGANVSFKAKVEASIDSKFMPLRANATCTIRPQGLIAENYVDCDPGSPPSPVLRASHGQPPTVPVENTTEPVSLLDLFNIFNVPTRERFALIVNELGIGTAGEGQNFNDVLYRANPSLKLADQVIGILAGQRAQLASLIDNTNTIAQEGASHTGDVQRFLEQAATLSSTTAAHRSPLEQAIKRLPGLLAAAQPSLGQLDIVARDGTPLLKQIRASAPYLNRVNKDLGPFVAQAKPGLKALSAALTQGIPAINDVRPVVSALRAYTERSLSKTQLSGRLFTSLQHAGFLENFLGIVYYVGAALARFDATSHLLDFSLLDVQNGACSAYATSPVAGCSANYGAAPASSGGTASGAARRKTASATPQPSRRRGRATPAHGTTSSQGRTGTTGANGPPAGNGSPAIANSPPTSTAPAATGTTPSTSASGTTGTSSSGPAPPSGTATTPQQPGSGSGGAGSALQNLINYLLR